MTERQALEQALVEATSESDEGLVTVTLPDGSSMVDLAGRFMSVVVATPTADGGVAIGCHTGEDAVAHAFLITKKNQQAIKACAAAAPHGND